MATTLALRRRIRTARNISKTTRAMQMIAASRLKKAQDAAVSTRPYVTKLVSVTQSLAPVPGTVLKDLHPFMQHRKGSGKTLYILISPDKGLCGGLITNIAREYVKFKSEHSSVFVTIGKKIEGIVASSHKNLLAAFPFGNTVPSFVMVAPINKIITEQYLGGHVDSVKIITTKFTNVFSQSPAVIDLLPIALESEEVKEAEERVFEPSRHELVPALLERYMDMVIYQQLLESYASEQAARMVAMQNATNNAKDVVNALTLLYNKARQEKITKEILDITSGAVAMEQSEE